MQKNKLLSMIGLCRKAGKLKIGFDAVDIGLKKNQVRLVLIASDISENSRNPIKYTAEKNGIKFIEISLTMEELQKIIGKKAGIFGIADESFANGIKNMLIADDEEEQHIDD